MVAGTLSCKYSAYLISMFEASILNSSTAYSDIIMIGNSITDIIFVKSKTMLQPSIIYTTWTTQQMSLLIYNEKGALISYRVFHKPLCPHSSYT